jgi:hypothetical protein
MSLREAKNEHVFIKFMRERERESRDDGGTGVCAMSSIFLHVFRKFT